MAAFLPGNSFLLSMLFRSSVNVSIFQGSRRSASIWYPDAEFYRQFKVCNSVSSA